MLETTTTCLLCAIVVVALIQPNVKRFIAAAIFSVALVLFDLSANNFSDYWYYIASGASNLLIVFLISFISPPPKMAIRLQVLSLIMMVVNFTGFILWYLYYPPFIYDLAFAFIFAVAIYILIERKGWGYDLGGYSISSWRSCLSFNNYVWIHNLIKNKGSL